MDLRTALQPLWIAFGIDEIRPSPGCTYVGNPNEDLPPLVLVPGDLSWLESPLPPAIESEMRPYRTNDAAEAAYRTRLDAILAQADREGIALPEAFVRLAGDRTLRDHVPSCTACYFDLPDAIVSGPFAPEQRILRFLNDQQVCFCWYLLFEPDREPIVLVSSGTDDTPCLEDVPHPISQPLAEKLRQQTFIAAGSFEEFIRRFWIENMIWYSLQLRLPLAPDLLAYIRHFAPDYRDPNAGHP
jgi:hypothetical protein